MHSHAGVWKLGFAENEPRKFINFPPAGYKTSPLGGTALSACSFEYVASICGILPGFYWRVKVMPGDRYQRGAHTIDSIQIWLPGISWRRWS